MLLKNRKAIKYINKKLSYLKRIDIINYDINSVKKNGMTLEFCQKQTPEICLKAVKQNGLNFRICQKNKHQRFVSELLNRMD